MTTELDDIIAHYKPKIETLRAAIDILISLQFTETHKYDKEIAGLLKVIEDIQYMVFKHSRVI